MALDLLLSGLLIFAVARLNSAVMGVVGVFLILFGGV